LAGAKLGAKVKGLDPSAYSELLLPLPTDTESDCIEVHIYGQLQVASVASVVIREPKRRPDRSLQRSALHRLKMAGIPTEVRP
jgi:hypothetical protein